MRIKLYGGSADGTNVVTDKSREGMQTFPIIESDGTTTLYFRIAHCGHFECPVTFVHPALQRFVGE